MNFELTIVIPCYNEAGRLGGIFDLIHSHLDLSWEWLFVNDGSKDGTDRIIRKFAGLDPQKIRLLSLPENSGKGRAVREGIMKAKAPLLGYVDADLSASPLLFSRFLDSPELLAGREIIVGIRKNSKDCHVKRHFYRHVLGRFYKIYASFLTGLRIYDTQCGFKLLAAGPAREIASAMVVDGYSFDVELLLRASHLGLRLREAPIPWEEKKGNKIRPHHLVEMALDVHRIWWRLNVLHKYQPE
jgi:dolichyl-phosphate beta-glucosyltransferase